MIPLRKPLSFIIAIIAAAIAALFFLAPNVYAQDTSYSASVSADVEASEETNTQERPVPVRPLQILNIKTRDARVQTPPTHAEIRTNADIRREEGRSTHGTTTRPAAGAREMDTVRRTDTKAQVEVRAKMQIAQVARTMKQRLEAAIERLENISARIDARLQKLQAAGKDTTASIALHVEAKAAIEKANVSVAAIVAPEASADTREAHKASFEVLRASVKAGQEAVQTAHRALMAVVAEMKKLGDIEVRVDAAASSQN